MPRLNNYEGKNKMINQTKNYRALKNTLAYETQSYLKSVDDRLSWVKKLGQWHLSGGNGQTLCGVPMLGNNYAKYIPENERTKCDKCFGGRS